ncbi:MAG: SOS response-associated peptidase [Chloroflexi bacterium]|nr:MAG: SOS response-associated peptidase [Chloroflexota bacterium]TME46229.1 MAG: SOS response-associated peptidase [Chloroflexota bacterium]
MCGRIGASMPRAELLETYHWLSDAPELPPRYNVAPTDPVIVVGPDRAEVVRWGIDGNQGGLFNLRSETALDKPYYQRMLLGQRVIVPASHFYEWRKAGDRRLPMAVSRADGKLLNLAAIRGLWDGQPATTILTTGPNSDIAALHDRMPVVLNDEDAATWVLEEMSLEQLAGLLGPCPDGWLRLAPASPLVNDVHNQGPELLDPEVLPAEFQLELL